ncbi:MAG: LD-carboxypeptidase [Phycisphaerae bacterium]|nr:LD-carboxypeptidase [Phycisphaerae bacterium]MDW8262678.1 LD-carboxypeptidase [Phycisphaerales bacterium]
MRIGLVALSSVVPPVEFEAGCEVLRSHGFELIRHPQVLSQHWLHAGSDAVRVQALMDFAFDPAIDVVWCARGGYGAARLLPLLDRLTAERGLPPRKLLVGYSDVTVAHEYVRNRWNWSTLHAAMPAAAGFPLLPVADLAATAAAVARKPAIDWPWRHTRLRWVTPPPPSPLEAPLIGGNLSLWQCLAGTPYAPPRRPHILFLEDLGEKFYRIDRMMTHLDQSGLLDTCVAIVLGDFTDCNDEVQTCLAASPGPPAAEKSATPARQPLRPVFQFDDLLEQTFGSLGLKRNLPVAFGLPVGHGQRHAPLPLGGLYRLHPEGMLELIHWSWTSETSTVM